MEEKNLYNNLVNRVNKISVNWKGKLLRIHFSFAMFLIAYWSKNGNLAKCKLHETLH
jgi:hypothetical protein